TLYDFSNVHAFEAHQFQAGTEGRRTTGTMALCVQSGSTQQNRRTQSQTGPNLQVHLWLLLFSLSPNEGALRQTQSILFLRQPPGFGRAVRADQQINLNPIAGKLLVDRQTEHAQGTALHTYS